jgi:flavodoxin
MKALVIYDSVAGNTRKIAEAIAGSIEGCHANAISIAEANPMDLSDVKLLIVGSPSHGLKPSPSIMKFIELIPEKGLDGINVAAFDTRIVKENIKKLMQRLLSETSDFAARPIAEALRKKGGTLVLLPEPFFLEGEEGPLREGEVERAATWGRLACHA